VAAAVAYALRRTSVRAVLVVGAAGLVWTVWVEHYSWDLGKGDFPKGVWIAWHGRLYPLLDSGLSVWDLAAAAVVAAVAVVGAVALWRERGAR
jgi:hypothetical protein